MFGIGPPELIVIFLIVLLLFGGKKIPEIAKGLGRGMREFRKAKDEIQDTLNDEGNEDETDKKIEDDDEEGENSSNKQSSAEDEKNKTE